MLTMRRAFKNIWRNKYRTLLVSLVLALCVAVFVSTIAGVNASEDATAEILEEYSEIAEATVEEAEMAMTAIMVTTRTKPPTPIDNDAINVIPAIDGVEAVIPMVSGGFGEAEGGGGKPAYMVSGVPLDTDLDEQYHYLPSNIIDGRSLEEGEDYAVLIGENLTDYFGAGVGDFIEIEGTEFEVVGVYASGFQGNQVYMELSAAQDLLGMQGQLTSMTVYAEDVSDVDDVVADIEEAYPAFFVISMSDMRFKVDRIVEQQEGIISTTEDNLSNIQSMGLSVTIVSVAIGVLLIFGLMFYTVRERTKEIGTLKALGFSNRNVMTQFMYEGFYVGLIGGVIGIGIAAVSASVFSSWLLDPSETLDTSVTVAVTAGVLLLGLGVAAIAGALGSLYPAWRASRVSPMEALRNE